MAAKRFKMDTASFISIWKNHMGKDDMWKKFVLNCFDRFTAENEFNNRELCHKEDGKWKNWEDEQKYNFLSERCYSKAIAIQRTLDKNEGFKPALPDGYLSRKGSGTSKRLTTKDMVSLFK